MTAFEFYLRGLELHRLGGVADANFREALEWYGGALEAGPGFSHPQAMWVCARANLPDFDLADANRRVERALELDADDLEANRIMLPYGSGVVHMMKRARALKNQWRRALLTHTFGSVPRPVITVCASTNMHCNYLMKLKYSTHLCVLVSA